MKILKIFVVLIFTTIPIGYLLAQGIEERQTRSHQLAYLSDDTSIEYTWIFHFKKENGILRSSQSYLLFELGPDQMWVYKSELQKTDSSRYEISHSFENINTKEALKISFTGLESGEKQYPYPDKYALSSNVSDKTVVVYSKDITTTPKDIHPYILENFSKTFVEGLRKIIDTVFKLNKENVSFRISPYDLVAIYGKTPQSEKLQIDESKQKNPMLLNYNCDFDAKFGYPCQPDEVPGKNPKVLVIEKKN